MRDLYESRKMAFRKFVSDNNRLPNTWEVSFLDGEDMRLWFDELSRTGLDDAKNFMYQIYNCYNIKILSQIERELEVIEIVQKNEKIPFQGEVFFSDGSDVFKWIYPVREDNKDFVRFINNFSNDYLDLDISMYLEEIKKDLTKLVKDIKRLPKYGEKKLISNIDARCAINKLMNLDQEYVERLLLHIESYKKNKLESADRAGIYLMKIDMLGYEPTLGECRFIDGTDMYTWVKRYKELIPFFKEEIEKRVISEKRRK